VVCIVSLAYHWLSPKALQRSGEPDHRIRPRSRREIHDAVRVELQAPWSCASPPVMPCRYWCGDSEMTGADRAGQLVSAWRHVHYQRGSKRTASKNAAMIRSCRPSETKPAHGAEIGRRPVTLTHHGLRDKAYREIEANSRSGEWHSACSHRAQSSDRCPPTVPLGTIEQLGTMGNLAGPNEQQAKPFPSMQDRIAPSTRLAVNSHKLSGSNRRARSSINIATNVHRSC